MAGLLANFAKKGRESDHYYVPYPMVLYRTVPFASHLHHLLYIYLYPSISTQIAKPIIVAASFIFYNIRIVISQTILEK
jgi:hypothetical protein